MSTSIYYFSGTGNSLYTANELAKRLQNPEIIPIVACLKREKIEVCSEIAGFVFPNFCLTLPIPLKLFLDKAIFASATYIFAVCTRGGTSSEAFDHIDALLKKQKKRLHAGINITMPWNHPLGKENLTSEANVKRLDSLTSLMKQKLDDFAKAILGKEDYEKPDADVEFPLPGWVKLFFISKTINYELHRYMYQKLIKFYSDSKCTECGTCEKVCLSGKITLKSGKPVWNNDVQCFGCFACINYCLHKAIQVKSQFPVVSHTTETGRYHHPEVSAAGLAAQKGV